jgi:hypothetical protein
MASESNSESGSPRSSPEQLPKTSVVETSDDNSVAAPESSDPTALSTADTAATDNTTTGTWQAVWSPQHNAYYFYNPSTQETTWINPLQPVDADAGATVSSLPDTSLMSGTVSSGPARAEIQAAAAKAAGIDPSLAYLDPTLSSAPGVSALGYVYTAKFNARTGAFTKPDARDPTHVSEYERAKRMSEFYFDVHAWEREVEQRKQLEQQQEADGSARKRKRPTKADLVSAIHSW